MLQRACKKKIILKYFFKNICSFLLHYAIVERQAWNDILFVGKKVFFGCIIPYFFHLWYISCSLRKFNIPNKDKNRLIILSYLSVHYWSPLSLTIIPQMACVTVNR